jgi:hypothetical protein
MPGPASYAPLLELGSLAEKERGLLHPTEESLYRPQIRRPDPGEHATSHGNHDAPKQQALLGDLVLASIFDLASQRG